MKKKSEANPSRSNNLTPRQLDQLARRLTEASVLLRELAEMMRQQGKHRIDGILGARGDSKFINTELGKFAADCRAKALAQGVDLMGPGSIGIE